jgi:hypothetical protein
MKTSKTVLICLVMLLVAGVLLWLRKEATTSQDATGTSLQSPPVKAVQLAEPEGVSARQDSKGDLDSTGASQADNTEVDRQELLVVRLRQANQTVEFYGRVLDQDGRPLSGVEVLMELAAVREMVPDKPGQVFEEYRRVSDEEGRFNLSGVEGLGLSVKSLEKQGYIHSSKPFAHYSYRRNESEPHARDATSPVLFQMWKKLGAEPLVHASKFYGIIPDGRSYSIDFLEKKKLEGRGGGDLIVQITRDKPAGQAKYDWSFSIEGIGGGVIESTNEFMFLAPENGYQARYEFAMTAGQTNWAGRITKSFFVRSRNGQVHTRMVAEVFSDYRDQAVFKVEYFSNPAGSRVLEYDPLQGLNQPR